MLLEYIESITKPLAGKKKVVPHTVEALRNAGFTLTNLYTLELKGHSGDAWLNGNGVSVQIGSSVSGRTYNGHIVTYARVADLKFVNEAQYNSWCRMQIIDDFIATLAESVDMLPSA